MLNVAPHSLYDLPEHLDATNEREITQVAFDLFVNSLSDDFSRPPATGRHRKAFHPEHIWMFTCHYRWVDRTLSSAWTLYSAMLTRSRMAASRCFFLHTRR